MKKYQITLQKIGNNIIGFNITANNFTRNYSMVDLKEFETTDEFIARKKKSFLDEIKDYRKIYHLIEI